MPDSAVPAELIDYLCRSSRLTAEEAERVVNEVFAFFDDTPEAFLRQRHQELQSLGHSNAQIFQTLQVELQQRRFCAKAMTTRQIRRAIYG